MARPKATATAEPPVSKTDDDAGHEEEHLEEPVAPADASKTDEDPASTGADEPSAQEPRKRAKPSAQEPEKTSAPPEIPDDHPTLRALREAQAAADRRANNLDRQLNELVSERVQRDRETRRERLRQLKETDPDAYIEEREKEDELAEQETRSWSQYEETVVGHARQHAAQLFPDLSAEELSRADAEIDELAGRHGRRANAVERLAMYGELRARKAYGALTAAQNRIKELEEQVAALEGKRTAEIVDGEDEGPDTPVNGTSSGGGKLTLARWQAMTPAERLNVPEAEEVRMIREEMRRRSGAR